MQSPGPYRTVRKTRPEAACHRGIGRQPGSERGSLLLAAMLFAIGLAIVLGSYLTLGRTTLKVAHRSYFANDATNLAEAGLEKALYCFNQMNAGTAAATAWTGWTLAGSNAMITLPTFNRDQHAVGIVKVYVTGYDGTAATPGIISQAVLTPFDGGAPIIKTVKLALKSIGTTVNGVVALGGLTLKDNTFVDSFNSNPSGSPTGPWSAYASNSAKAKVAVVVLAGSITAMDSSKIKGDLKLGTGVAAPPTNDYTGTLTTDFKATFPMPAYPTAAGVSRSYNLGGSIPSKLPRTGDQPAADGRYYYFCSGTTIGNVAITAGNDVTIVGTNTGMSAGFSVGSQATCKIYMDKTVSLGTGKTINSTNWAGALEIYTTTTGTCSFASNSRITAVFFAPSANISASGSGGAGALTGSFVANTITLADQMAIHFDEALAGASGSGGGWKGNGWLELQTAADRATVAALTGNFLR